MSKSLLGRQNQVWFILLAMNAGCAGKTRIPWEHRLYLSTLEVCSQQGAVQIHVYLYLCLSDIQKIPQIGVWTSLTWRTTRFASIGLVSPGAATGGLTLIFSRKNWQLFCSSLSLLLISLVCHTPLKVSPCTFFTRPTSFVHCFL